MRRRRWVDGVSGGMSPGECGWVGASGEAVEFDGGGWGKVGMWIFGFESSRMPDKVCVKVVAADSI